MTLLPENDNELQEAISQVIEYASSHKCNQAMVLNFTKFIHQQKTSQHSDKNSGVSVTVINIFFSSSGQPTLDF